VANDISATAGTGTLAIDAGATLVLSGQLQNQTIDFAANSSRQFANGPIRQHACAEGSGSADD